MENEITRFSFSDLRKFRECPFKLQQMKLGKYKEATTDAMLVGRYAHALLESDEAAERFVELNADVMIGNKGKSNQAVKKAYLSIMPAITQVKQTDYYKQVADGEKEIKLTAEREKYTISGIIDNCTISHEKKEFLITDWKTAANFETQYDEYFGARVEWYEKYLPQVALYAYLISKNFPDYNGDYTIKARLVGFTKEAPINMQVVEINLGKLNEIEDNVYTSNVLYELDEMADYYAKGEIEACCKCGACAVNQKIKEIKL